ncbi:unnamed protein product, partial [Mesorhabditis spiculigera]
MHRGRLLIAALCFATCLEAANLTCSPSKIWLDVEILFDSSSATNATGYFSMINQVKSAFQGVTLGQGLRYQTRIGVIAYAAAPRNVANLKDFKSYADFDNLAIPYLPSEVSDLTSAVDLARQKLYDVQVTNRQKVILIASEGYRQGHFASPNASVETFKLTGGIVVVLSFEDGPKVSKLQDLASPGYFLDASKGLDGVKLVGLLCQANYFCPCIGDCSDPGEHFVPGSNDIATGCFWYGTGTSTQLSAREACPKLELQSTLAQTKDISEALAALNPYRSGEGRTLGVWVGLTNNGSAAIPDWRWLDGTRVDLGIAAQLKPASDAEKCAYLKPNGGFLYEYDASTCLVGRYFACRTEACTSDSYCAPTSPSFAQQTFR